MALILETDNNLYKFFNMGINSFGHKNVIDIINSFYTKYTLPIISMGSGTGIIEYLSQKENNEIKWICIDINNNPLDFPINCSDYINKPFMNINYLSCDELIKTNTDIIGNCLLFLNWCLPNDSFYDFDAIIKLKPIAILSIYEEFEEHYGAAGGKMFFNWTKNNTDYNLIKEYSLYADKYHRNDDELMDIRISWWQSNSIHNDKVIIKGYPCMCPNNKKNTCIIS
jgi:hypothetical protein